MAEKPSGDGHKMLGKKFKDKVTQHVYRVKKPNDWAVLIERQDNRYEILTTVRILKAFYEQLRQ